ncbi:hypothetical protein [Rufibacter quisquiliarum]|uniref:Molybdopterin converting factor small subunit n=1 Tax=Rufibacter quisquiliarum TaxID=1549639 RepID=A0A839GPJ5_9BACT|nr:hypothetical protein [Rufibacter quisquiliarum]MBA9079913.1 molybdopterin converting factor small subunit [Rufibacter quisquiliarum]
MKKILLLFFALLNFATCRGQSAYVILKDKETITDLITIYKVLPESSTTTELSEAELDLVKKASIEYIKDFNTAISEEFRKRGERKKYAKMYQIENLSNYKIQYVPYLNGKGEKEIWINGFCNDFDKDWRRELIHVFDGGNCYFTIRLNLTTGERLGIGTNGYA